MRNSSAVSGSSKFWIVFLKTALGFEDEQNVGEEEEAFGVLQGEKAIEGNIEEETVEGDKTEETIEGEAIEEESIKDITGDIED